MGGMRTSLAMPCTLALPTPNLRRQTRRLQDLLPWAPGLKRGLPVGHGAVLTMQEFALLSVWPCEDGIVTVQLRLRVHQAAAQHRAFVSDACKGVKGPSVRSTNLLFLELHPAPSSQPEQKQRDRASHGPSPEKEASQVLPVLLDGTVHQGSLRERPIRFQWGFFTFSIY